ncbi:glycoside hydrolase family 140 protein [Ferruginibacter sp.]
MKKYFTIVLLIATFFSNAQMQPLKIAANKRYFATKDGKPFFWLGDTGWLLLKKCKKEEAIAYLDDRKQKGFNVIQVMLLHELDVTDAYDDSALINKNVATPNLSGKYNYWDNVDFVIKEAAKRNIYMALVPVWGGNIKYVSVEQAKTYATFLANRYKNKTNIIWLNGGDIKGADALDKWNALGSTLRAIDKNHLITFHPRGRNSSSAWFQNEKWMDFNMFQSGHRSYAQDTSANETLHYGEDNWKYVEDDYNLIPTKPTFDGEPSYEDIPYGLHKSTDPYWQDYEIRRYAYWSVFAGAAGFTYGHNSVMQFYTPGDSGISFFPKIKWQDGLSAPGAMQMQYLKKLMLNKSYFDRVPDQAMIIGNGEKYERVLGTKGKGYAMFYVYNGRSFEINTGRMGFQFIKTSWFNPRNGSIRDTHISRTRDTELFKPPGKLENGNDWVLIIEKVTFKNQ